MAFMLVAGWQFNLNETEKVFHDKEVALENAFAGSNSFGGVCCMWRDSCRHPLAGNIAGSIWVSGSSVCI